MADVTVLVTTPSTITATATTLNTYAVSVSSPSTVSVSASVGNVGDMTKAIYDTDNNGVVDNATALGGLPAGFYALQTDLHTRQHSITSTSDHTSTATSGRILQADANGLPVNATNTDAQVAAAVTASHAAVTVADTASIDMTLTGQQVSAAAIFGTGAGVVAEGNHTHYSYYSLQTAGVAAANPADGSTYYFGGENNATTGANIRNIPFPFAGTIVYAAVVILVNTVLGDATTFSCYIRINNTTDVLITSTATATAAINKFSNTALSTAVSVNDYFEGKIVYPTWPTTNPTGVKAYFVVGVRV